FTLDADF
nr:Chain B, FTLDADF [synthetic construct]